ncbi:Gfo/Idh/MocA family protein [Paenibacillus solisilvae]|uniref:Gfo/Idh/MocA family protein n=1 Tax=Paenibacillus solisilvae TaxID=2486751 RepID=A0ABW0W384_9BACL
MTEKIKVGIVGLGFGAEFIPIYQNHPHAEMYAICQRNEQVLNTFGDHFQIPVRYTSYEEMLQDPSLDAVHINTPIPNHAEHAIAALLAGKHVACTVPMAASIEDCCRIIEAQQASGKSYMMMETAVFSREFLYIKSLHESGELGRIQFLRGSHHQNMEGWPGYWEGLPPMHYSSHAIGPLLALAGKDAEMVTCMGSGQIAEHLAAKYGSPYAVESALFKLEDSDLAAEVTRSLFQTAREYLESFDVYAEHMSFEWRRLDQENPFLFRGDQGRHAEIPDFDFLLPEGIRAYASGCLNDLDEHRELGLKRRSSHGGSHPHMAHEFISSIAENRQPFPDVFTAANWTAAGLCAHESALRGGEPVRLPFEIRRRKA